MLITVVFLPFTCSLQFYYSHSYAHYSCIPSIHMLITILFLPFICSLQFYYSHSYAHYSSITPIIFQEFINQMNLAQAAQQQKEHQTNQSVTQAQLAQHATLFNYTTTDGTLPLLDRSIMEPLLQNSPAVRAKAPVLTTPLMAGSLISPAPMSTTLPPASTVIPMGQNGIILGATALTHPGSGSATPTPQPITIIQPTSFMDPTKEVLPEEELSQMTVVGPQSGTYFECTGCERLFTRVEALIDHHQANHGVLPFQCCFCDTRYDTAGALDRHLPTCIMDRQQLPPMVFRCGRCWVAFGMAMELMSHAQSCPLLPAHQQQALLAASAAASNATSAMFSPLKVNILP